MPDEHDPDLETTRQTPVGEEPEIVAGRYRILRTLGRGGGGIVWLAQDEHLGREVALKRVAGEADAEILVTRGLREARTSAALAHDHVVRVYDAFVHEGSPWIVMEYVPGPSLSALLEGGRHLPVRQVARIGAQVATALAAAHGAGVLHRDVKPGNVLLTDESGHDAKLTDFGIARAEDDHQLTRTGMVSGTAAYFSPELARGEEPSVASDAWALGATLYTAVEGRRPYPDAGNPVAQLHMIARDAPDAPRRAGPLEPVLRGLLDPDPSRRWTAEQAARALTEIAEGRPAPAYGAPGAGAAAAAAGGAAAALAGGPGRNDLDATQVVGPGRTRQVPVEPGNATGRAAAAPDPRTADHAYAARPDHGADGRHAAYPDPATGQGPVGGPPAGRRRRPRGTVVAAWLLGIPLAILLGWLIWSIASGDRTPQEEAATPSATATQDQPVTVEEAESTVRAFYTTLQDEGLDAARQYMVDGVPVDDGIAIDLTSIDVTIDDARESGEGVEVVATAAYTYGETRVITQQETMQVARRGTEALIVERITRTVSDTGGEGGSDSSGQGGDDNPADENGSGDAGTDRGEGNDNSGSDQGEGNDNSGEGGSGDGDSGGNGSGDGGSGDGGNGSSGDGGGSTGGPGSG